METLEEFQEAYPWIKLDVGENQLAFSADTNADAVYAVFETSMLYGGV